MINVDENSSQTKLGTLDELDRTIPLNNSKQGKTISTVQSEKHSQSEADLDFKESESDSPDNNINKHHNS